MTNRNAVDKVLTSSPKLLGIWGGNHAEGSDGQQMRHLLEPNRLGAYFLIGRSLRLPACEIRAVLHSAEYSGESTGGVALHSFPSSSKCPMSYL